LLNVPGGERELIVGAWMIRRRWLMHRLFQERIEVMSKPCGIESYSAGRSLICVPNQLAIKVPTNFKTLIESLMGKTAIATVSARPCNYFC
jgi:hypothetical protein